MRSVFAIDGGLKGYACVLVGDRVLLSKVPTATGPISLSVLHLGKDTVDYRPIEMLRLVDQAIALDPDIQFVMEEPPQNINGGSSRHSILSQWRGYGIWNAVVGIRSKVLYLVASTTWKAYFKLTKHTNLEAKKEDALVLARELYPKVNFPAIDAADACLIGTYFRDNVEIKVVPRRVRSQTRK